MVDGVSELNPGGDRPISALEFAARAALVALQITLVIYLGQSGVLFFYQLF